MEIQLFDTSISQPSIFKSGLIEGAKLIGADKFQERGKYGEGVVIACIDSGCDINHPNLKDRIVGYKNFTDDDKQRNRLLGAWYSYSRDNRCIRYWG